MNQDRVQEFYNKNVQNEWDRLEKHFVEFEITTRHLKPFISDKKRIADIGGGPGRYAFHYAKKGHSVSLLDLSEKNIEFAQQKAKTEKIPNVNFYCSSATNMPMLKNSNFDIVLCFGPMYHLSEKIEHLQVIDECYRILKDNGILAMIFLTPWSHIFSAIENESDRLLHLNKYFTGLVKNQRNLSRQDIPFPNGWNPKPENIKGFMESHYFKTEKIVAIETPFGRHLENKIESMDTPAKKAWMDYIFMLSTEESLLGACEHVLYIGKK